MLPLAVEVSRARVITEAVVVVAARKVNAFNGLTA